MAALVTLLSGCAAPRERIAVEITPAGIIQVEGKRIRLDDIGKAVKRRGAISSTVIEVQLPEGGDPGLQYSVGQRLATAGYKRTIFRKPRIMDAEVPGFQPPAGF